MSDARKAALRELAKRELAARQEAEKPKSDTTRDMARAGVQGMLMGFGDEYFAGLSAALGRDPETGGMFNYDKPIGERYSQNLDTIRDQEDRFREERPALAIGSEIAGALVPGAGAAGLVGRGAGLLSRMGIGATAGAVTGTVQGYGSGEGGVQPRLDNALAGGVLGGVIGGAIPAAGAGVRKLAQGRAARGEIAGASRNAPSSEALRSEGSALYRQIDDAGVQIRPEAFDRARGEIRNHLRDNTGFDELPGPGSLTPNTSRVMNIMDEAGSRMAAEPTAALPFRALDQMRRQAGAAAGNVTNKTDQRAGVAVIQQLDDFVQKLGPDDIAGGDVQSLQSAIGKAREVWSRMSRSQLVDDAMERSDNYLSGSASGLRNQFKNILQNKKLAAQFSDAEKAALRQVTHGGALDQLINLAGGGLAQMGSIGGGFALGGPLGAVAGAGLAAGQRKLAETVTMRSAERARAAIASGALRDPEIMNRLVIAGQRPEFLTNTGLNALATPARQ